MTKFAFLILNYKSTHETEQCVDSIENLEQEENDLRIRAIHRWRWRLLESRLKHHVPSPFDHFVSLSADAENAGQIEVP